MVVKKLTEEHKQNISKGLLGRRHSSKTIEKIKIGNLGLKRSVETRQKIRDSMLGKKLTKEHKKNISLGNLGRVFSDETRKKISDANKGKYFLSEESKKIGADKKRGRKHTKEAIEKIRVTSMRPCKESTKQKISVKNTGNKHTEITKKKISVKNKGKKISEKHRQTIINYGKNRIVTNKMLENFRFAAIKRVEKQRCNGERLMPTVGNYERIILDELELSIGFKILRQYLISGYYLDGYIHELNLAIEIDEEYHKKIGVICNDKIRQERIVNILQCDFVRVDVSEVYIC